MSVAGRGVLRDRTRADEVRSRRARLETSVEPAPRERPQKPPRAARPRRRLDVALPAERGAEVRLPSLPSVRVGPRLLSAVLLAIAAWALQSVLGSGSFRVAEAAVNGARMLTPSQVRSLARVDGEPVFLLDPRAVVERLLQEPEVGSAEVSVGWPNRVTITIQERIPVVEWVEGDLTWWVSSEGIAFLGRGAFPGEVRVQTEAPLLEITADPLEPVVAPSYLEAAVLLRTMLPEIEVLLADREHGLAFDDARGWRAYFGSGGDMVAKVRTYQALVEHFTAQGIQPLLVSVEDQHAPFYSLQRRSQ
jgi:cell division protein FtsQ